MMFSSHLNHAPPTFLGAGLAQLPHRSACIFIICREKNDFFACTAERHHHWEIFTSFQLHEVEFFPWAAPILLDIIDYALGRLPKEG